MNEVVIRVEGGVGRITLDRPKALHALNTIMCAAIDAALVEWAEDDGVRLVMIDHAEGTRGFCAGGDVRMVAESGRGDGKAGAEFFAVEYRMNNRIHAFPKPFVAVMDGVTMGGGVGISVHGSHRIATENTLFAMPETAIGLFPDVGGGWFLPRMAGEVGTWLALTGARLKGRDVLAAGIATHFVPAERLAEIKARLGREGPDEVLAEFAGPVEAPSYAAYIDVINRCFGHDSMTEILAALDAEGGWATEQAAILRTRAPLSLCVSLEQLRRGRTMASFAEVMRMEYRIACRIIRMHDFSEGVAAVVEKRPEPAHWQPQSVADVGRNLVEPMFEPLEQELQL